MRNQAHINSGFNKSSTASEVLAGLDLSGKTAIITGGHSGLGLQSTKALAAAGVIVIVGARNVAAAKQNLTDVADVTVLELDLSDLASVRRFAQNITDSKVQIDMLICNAGVMACPEQRVGSDWESQFATNHIGHYVLTNLIWDSLKNGSRVVCVSSAAHHFSPMRWDDIHFENEPYDKWTAYGQSKTANALFALQLDEYGQERNIRAFSLHPGSIKTPLQRHLDIDEMIAAGWVDKEGNVIDPKFKSPEQGAATQVWAATSPKLAGLGGLYCEDCEVAKPASAYSKEFCGVCDYATDLDEAKKLWALTAELTGINAFG